MTEAWTEIATDVDGRPVLRTVRVHVADGPDRGATVQLERGSVILGKGEGADLVLSDKKTSRAHVELALLDTGVRVTDLGSTNGTFFRGARLEGALVLQPPFEVTVGSNRVQVAMADVPFDAAPAPRHVVAAPVGPSASAHRIREALGRVADRRVPVCIVGPRGVGKSVAARALVEAAGVSPCVVVHLGPGLDAAALGRHVADAAGGALVIEDLEAATADQLDALTAPLDQRERGALELWPITTSRLDPRHLVEEGRLPRSLFFQLAPVRLAIPSLDERPEDADELARLIAEEEGAGPDAARAAVAALGLRGFPDDGWGLRRRVVELVTLGRPATGAAIAAPPLSYKEAKAELVDRFTARYVRDLLARHDGNVTRAAEEAGIARQTFAALLKRYDLDG